MHNFRASGLIPHSHVRSRGCYQPAALETSYSPIFFKKNPARFCDTNHVGFWLERARHDAIAELSGGKMLTRRDILIGTGLAGVAALARPITSVFASAAQPKTPVNFKVPAG